MYFGEQYESPSSRNEPLPIGKDSAFSAFYRAGAAETCRRRPMTYAIQVAMTPR
jgi:hypothetical protein